MLKALTILKDQSFANLVVGQTLTIPVWTTVTRPTPATDGMIGFNSDLDAPEYYDSAAAAQANAVAATADNPATGVPLVAGAVEVLRFPAGWYFSGVAGAATTVYITPGEGL